MLGKGERWRIWEWLVPNRHYLTFAHKLNRTGKPAVRAADLSEAGVPWSYHCQTSDSPAQAVRLGAIDRAKGWLAKNFVAICKTLHIALNCRGSCPLQAIDYEYVGNVKNLHAWLRNCASQT